MDDVMAVQFILGRSGTGKTSYCVRVIADALAEASEQPLIFLVPEQASYQAERAILSDERIAGYHRLHILSFDRLQFLLLGKDAARQRLSRLGRQMLVHEILREVQDELQVFRSSALLPGFARQMAETVTELHRYAHGPEDVADLVAQAGKDESGRLAELKFADIGLVFGRYCELLEEKFTDPDARVNDACRVVARADFIRGARIWVDGFAGFTGAELTLLTELLKAAEHTCIALCIDPARANPRGGKPSSNDGLFEPTERTYLDLLDWAGKAKIAVGKPVVLGEAVRFATCPALAHVEANIFRPGAAQARAGEHIRLIAAANLRAEIQFVTRQILDLVGQRGLRYRDIAVVASDLNQYEHYVRAYFDDNDIPYFIDKRKALNQHPVVELIATALQIVTGGFAHADVFAYLKTGLVPIAAERIDTLENYCLAFGVDGRDWTDGKPWQFQSGEGGAFDEEEIERVGAEVVRPLLALRRALCPEGEAEPVLTASAFTRAVFDLLETLGVRETLGRWVQEAHEAGDLTAADEHRQFWDKLVDIFDELTEVFGRDEMAAADYSGILHAAFSQMTLAFIPPSLDQVLVGSIERSRHPNLKAVFLVGATQRQFPVPLPSAGLLTDEDRDAAEAAEFPLAPTTTQSLTERKYLAYIAFTRPSEFLCVSCPSVDEKGSPVVRSHFVDELQSLFDDLETVSIEDEQAGVSDLRNEPELAELLCGCLGRDVFSPAGGGDEELAQLWHALRADDDYAATTRTVATALSYDNRASLSPAVVAELFGPRVKGSATRLGTFAACPYKHFARYTLELKPRREFKLEPLDLGRFYHEVLDALHKRLAADGQNFATVADDRLLELLRVQIADLTGRNTFMAHFIARSDHNAFVISSAAEVLEDCVREIAQMLRAGAFRPAVSEVGFGDVREAEQNLGTFELSLPNGSVLVLNGMIDRLDVAEIDGKKAALIFDYKRTRSAAHFDWSKLYHGLDMQLPMYVLAVYDAGASYADRAVGAFFMPIEHTPQSVSFEGLAKQADRFGRKASGFFDGKYSQQLDPQAGAYWSRFYNFTVTKGDAQYGRYANSGALKPDDFEAVLQYVRDKMLALAGEMVAGRVAVHPYRLARQAACAYCDYRAVCRFDWQVNEYRILESKGKLDVVGEGLGE